MRVLLSQTKPCPGLAVDPVMDIRRVTACTHQGVLQSMWTLAMDPWPVTKELVSYKTVLLISQIRQEDLFSELLTEIFSPPASLSFHSQCGLQQLVSFVFYEMF